MARKLRSKNGPRDSRNRAPPSKEANSIQIDVPPRRRQIRVLLGLFQQLVEFLFEHLAVRFLRFELLAENLVAPPGLALQLGHRRRQIFDRGPLLGINFQNRVAAGTLDLEQTLRHSAHRSTHGVRAYKPSESNCEDLEGFRGFWWGDWLEGTKRGINRFSLGLLFVCHALIWSNRLTKP